MYKRRSFSYWLVCQGKLKAVCFLFLACQSETLLQAGMELSDHFFEKNCTWCFTALEGRYAGQLAKSVLTYSIASWCFNCINTVVVLVGQLYTHAEDNVAEVIVQDTPRTEWYTHRTLRSGTKKGKTFTMRSAIVGVTRVFENRFGPSSAAFVR